MQTCCGSQDDGLCSELGRLEVRARDGVRTHPVSLPNFSSTAQLGAGANRILHFILKHIH